jgi:D-alanine-D-alanine ligase
MAGIPFVGADALTLGITLDKIIAKKIFLAEGIPTPKFFEVKTPDSFIDTDHMKFPLIVKPRFEGSSKGLTNSSRVENEGELKKQIEYIISNYKQPALVEEFITGREFTVVVVGNDPAQVLPVVQVEIDGELDLQNKFYTFARISSDRVQYICPARIEEALKKEISDIALRAYQSVDCRDFGRVDFRLDYQGNLYVLEINPLPCLSTEDVFPLVAREIGLTYEQIVGRILEVALERYNLT